MGILAGFAIVTTVYASCAALTWALPGRKVVGYACDVYTGQPYEYKLNGLTVLLTVLSTFLLLGATNIIPASYIISNYGACLAAANVYGLSGAYLLYIKGKRVPEEKRQIYMRAPTRDKPEKAIVTEDDRLRDAKRPEFLHFFFGQEFNLRFQMLDLKMFLYVVGAVMLGLNVYSAIALQIKQDEGISKASVAYGWMFTHFLFEYLFFEEIHLYTYDLFAEKLGFKLFWGCFVFYPFFYAIGSFGVVGHKSGRDINAVQLVAMLLLFYSGWAFTRGSNLQKYWFKQYPSQKTVFRGLIKQETIEGSQILCSGFWGLARHINYCGEIIQAIALALPGWLVSGSMLPWLYPLYYVLLFVPRQIDDDRICVKKYGDPWIEYMEKVPYRICPYVW